MDYLTSLPDIQDAIAHYSQSALLWLDTEVADYNTKKPRLSLIQILDHPQDLTGETVTILDVLHAPDGIQRFIQQIMENPQITKVFHNASYDCKFLGKKAATSVICTLKIAQKIPYYLLPVSDHRLKTLTEYFCPSFSVDKTEQDSDWGIRPLSDHQQEYAWRDVVYLAQVYQSLVKLQQKVNPNPKEEDLTALTLRYRQIEQQWKKLNSEIEHLSGRIQAAMGEQNLSETSGFKLSRSSRTTRKIEFLHLAKAMAELGEAWDFPVTLTQNIQKQLGDLMDKLPIQEETTVQERFTVQSQIEEEMPF